MGTFLLSPSIQWVREVPGGLPLVLHPLAGWRNPICIQSPPNLPHPVHREGPLVLHDVGCAGARMQLWVFRGVQAHWGRLGSQGVPHPSLVLRMLPWALPSLQGGQESWDTAASFPLCHPNCLARGILFSIFFSPAKPKNRLMGSGWGLGCH